MSAVITLNNISKIYPNAVGAIRESPMQICLNKLSFEVNKGDKLGIFGPNGAGKTTLISILCGIIEQSEGTVEFKRDDQQIDRKEILYKIGYVPQDFSFYSELTPYQNLMYFGSLYGIPKSNLVTKIDNLMAVLGLSHVMHKKIEKFSGGMKRRVNLAIGIINEPEILLLDEPTVGVDVQSKNAIMTYLEELNQKGTTIIYTSHHMSEGQDFCNRFILLDKGELIVNDTLDKLLTEYKESNLENLFLKLTGKEYRD